MELPSWLKFGSSKDKRASWETTPVELTNEAAVYVAELLKSEGNLAIFGGAVTAFRLIDIAAKSEFGPILESPEINPLSVAALEHLMEKGALDLSTPNIIRAYEEHRKSRA